jgi:hypothetical protein
MQLDRQKSWSDKFSCFPSTLKWKEEVKVEEEEERKKENYG